MKIRNSYGNVHRGLIGIASHRENLSCGKHECEIDGERQAELPHLRELQWACLLEAAVDGEYKLLL